MPITDKTAAAKRISELLNGIIATGDFRLRYKIMVDPPSSELDFDKPVIKVDLSGSDSPLVKERGGELLRAFEHVALEMLRLAPDEHDQIVFDCENFRSARQQELRLSANVAADRVRQSGMPYAFAPMSSRERRVWCTWHCAIWLTCAPKARANRCNATWSSIPRTTRAKRPHRRPRRGEDKASFVVILSAATVGSGVEGPL